MILWGRDYISLFTDEENEGWSKLPKITGLRVQAEAGSQKPCMFRLREINCPNSQLRSGGETKTKTHAVRGPRVLSNHNAPAPLFAAGRRWNSVTREMTRMRSSTKSYTQSSQNPRVTKRELPWKAFCSSSQHGPRGVPWKTPSLQVLLLFARSAWSCQPWHPGSQGELFQP